MNYVLKYGTFNILSANPELIILFKNFSNFTTLYNRNIIIYSIKFKLFTASPNNFKIAFQILMFENFIYIINFTSGVSRFGINGPIQAD